MAEEAPATEQPTTQEETTAAPADTEQEAKIEMSKEERVMEQKMVKIIEKMPEQVSDRFRQLYVYSDERSKINDMFEKEVKELSERFEQRKIPLLQKRDEIIYGTDTEFADACGEYDRAFTKCETAVAGIVKSEEEKA